MIAIRNANDRGRTNIGWLNAKHSFSFGRYYDPENMAFRALRVMNDDVVKAGMGFHPHPHDNMEILTYILSGSLSHKDSSGHERTISRGDVQHMSAGSGVVHSEFNASKTDAVHLYQIWLEPTVQDARPAYNERAFDESRRRNRLDLLASPDGADGSIRWLADARLWATILDGGKSVEAQIPAGRHAWVQVMRGAITLNGQRLNEGDGAAISEVERLTLTAAEGGAETLVFDLA